jgi:hypothetical protein
MSDGITEFTELDPESMHLVPAGANGFPFLLAKAMGEAIDEESDAASKAKLDAEARHSLSDSDFAYIDSKGGRHDAAHVRNALARFNQTHFESSEAKAKAHRKIVARAKELGIEVSAEKEVSTDESLSQTHEVDAGPGPAGSPEAGDGGEPRSVSFPHGEPGDGHGDTAPDKDLHRAEAESQTPGAQANKAEVDGGGDTAPDKDLHRDEAESQTEAEKSPFVTMDNSAATAGGSADSDPGSPAWEHKDAALADCASHLISRANELIQMLGQRERAEKGTAPLSQETEGAIRRSIEDLTKALTDNQSTVSKEEIDMTNDELIKLLDEREAARREAKKARKEKKVAKAAKKAAKAESTDGNTAEGADASKAAETEGATTEVAELRKQLAETQDLVAKMAGEDGKHAMLNGAGVAAVLRGPEGQSIMKSLEDRVAKAEERGDPDEIRTAKFQLAAAKLVAQENARERGDMPRSSRFGPNSTELFARTGTLGEDAQLRAV